MISHCLLVKSCSPSSKPAVYLATGNQYLQLVASSVKWVGLVGHMTWLRRCVLIAGTEVTVQVSLARYIYCTVLSSSISVVSDCLENGISQNKMFKKDFAA